MGLIRRVVGGVAILVIMVVMFAAGWLVAKTGIGATVAPASLSERERRFSELMKDSSLVGNFTLTGREDPPSRPDRYDFTSVDTVSDGRWRFNVRMRHATVDVTLPVTVPMEWVGDTPIIVLSDYAIPTMGTFGARVLFDGDRYAGTWQSGKFGGLMYGRIEKRNTDKQK